MSNKAKIHYSSPEAATYRTDIKGWVSRDGHFYGDQQSSEHTARYAGSTHRDCSQCGSEIEIRYTICDTCSALRSDAKFAALEAVEWDGKIPIALYDSDTYFFNEQELLDYCDSNEIQVSELKLVICDPIMGREFGIDDFCDELPEDGELPEEIWEAVENLNSVIRAHGPLSWYPGKVRAIVKGGAE